MDMKLQIYGHAFERTFCERITFIVIAEKNSHESLIYEIRLREEINGR